MSRMSTGRRSAPTSGHTPSTVPASGTAWAALALVLSLGLGAYLWATPIVDTDLWFHLAYARQMAATGSLQADHTAFSWTPSDNAVIYCAWIAQAVLYGTYKLGGIPGLVALRYAILAASIGALAALAHRLGVLRHPLAVLVLVLTMLLSGGAAFIKPQLFSYAFMTAIVVLWHFLSQPAPRREAWAYALPLLMLVWVNTHGGFVMGLAFLGAALTGDLLNARLSPGLALPPTVRRQVWMAAALCAAAIFVTPYGWRYPAQFVSVDLPALDLRAVREYDTIFAPSQRALHYVEYGAGMAALLLLALAISRARAGFDWSIALTNLLFAGLYAYYVRLTFFWAPVAAASIFTLVSRHESLASPIRPASRRVAVACLVASLALASHAILAPPQAVTVGSWVGFGNGYWNPEEEAEYVAQHFPTARIGNDYNSGGYLIWRLWPANRVFMDARYFPYRSWFQEYLGLESGGRVGAVVEKYRADLWCVSLMLPQTIAWFRASPEWTPAFYGSSAVVFVRSGTALPGGGMQSGARIGEIRNLLQAETVLALAFDLRDFAGAARVLSGMEQRFTAPRDRPVVTAARIAYDGLSAHASGDHEAAVRLLSVVAPAYQGTPAAALMESALAQTIRLWQNGDGPGALAAARVAARMASQSPMARYNAGAIGWWIARQSPARSDGLWQADLTAFLRIAPPGDSALAPAATVAREMLEGRAVSRPFILAPP